MNKNLKLFLSQSAKFEQLDEYTWYKYNGIQKVQIAVRTHKRTIEKNSLFGLRYTRNGTIYVILPEMYHVDFVVDRTTANKLLNKSDIVKRPTIKNLTDNNTGKIIRRAAAEIAAELSPNRVWDSPRYKAARNITNESVIDYSNYQWRKISAVDGFKLAKADRKMHYKHNDIIGMRFIKPATGGVLIDKNFNRFVLNTEAYDRIVSGSKVLPKSKWPEGKFSKEEAEIARQEELILAKQKRASERRALRELEAAKKREEEKLLKLKLAEERKERKRKELEARESATLLNEHIERVRKTAVIPMDDRDIRERVKQRRRLSAEDLGLKEEYLDNSEKEFELNLDGLTLNTDTKVERKEKPAELKDMLDQVIKDTKKDLTLFNMEDIESDPEDFEDDPEVQYEDSEVEHDLYEDEEKSKDLDLTKDPEDEDEDEYEPDEEVEIAEDELEEVEDSEEDELEEKKPEIKYEEGHVITFEQDASESREFLIYSIEPLKGNDHILIYKLYDIDNEPDEYRTVRIDTHKKRKIEDMAKMIRKVSAKDFIRYQAMAEDLMKNPEPIES
jgi:hypothetical protein